MLKNLSMIELALWNILRRPSATARSPWCPRGTPEHRWVTKNSVPFAKGLSPKVEGRAPHDGSPSEQKTSCYLRKMVKVHESWQLQNELNAVRSKAFDGVKFHLSTNQINKTPNIVSGRNSIFCNTKACLKIITFRITRIPALSCCLCLRPKPRQTARAQRPETKLYTAWRWVPGPTGWRRPDIQWHGQSRGRVQRWPEIWGLEKPQLVNSNYLKTDGPRKTKFWRFGRFDKQRMDRVSFLRHLLQSQKTRFSTARISICKVLDLSTGKPWVQAYDLFTCLYCG